MTPFWITETILESVEGTGFNIATAPQGPPVIQPAPAPARNPPPARNVARPQPALSPDVAAQVALYQRYNAVMVRAAKDKRALFQLQRTQAELPADLSDARSRLDDQLKAVLVALSRRDNDQASQNLQSAEDTLTVIEKYLGK